MRCSLRTFGHHPKVARQRFQLEIQVEGASPCLLTSNGGNVLHALFHIDLYNNDNRKEVENSMKTRWQLDENSLKTQRVVDLRRLPKERLLSRIFKRDFNSEDEPRRLMLSFLGYGVDVNSRNVDEISLKIQSIGETPFHISSMRGHIDNLVLLYENGATPHGITT